MSLRSEQLLPASFRGVPFQVSSAGITTGRRTVVHEYPQRDKPYVEDLGRATRQIKIKAFVVGDDYIEQARTLLAEIEKPGAGTLVHPWLGEMPCTLTATSELTFDQQLGMASVTLTATEAGELAFPSTGTDASSLALDAADAVEASAIDRFLDSIDLSVVSKYVDSVLSGSLLDVFGVISDSELAKVFGFADSLADLASKGLSLLSTDPKVFATKLAGALGLSRWATSTAAWSGVAKQLRNLVKNDKLSVGTKAKIEADKENRPLTDMQKVVMKNQAAVETVARQLLIAQMVGVSSIIGLQRDTTAPGVTLSAQAGAVTAAGTSSEEQAETVAKSYDELIEVRDALLEALDQELLLETDDETYQVLEEARVAIFEALTERADTKSKLVTITPPDVLPAVVLAYDYHDDAGRDREIALRNGIVHEGFCPAEAMKVLSE